MHFALSEEQELIVGTVRHFVEQEIYPHEAQIDKLGYVPDEIGKEIAAKCRELGFFGCNFPQEVGGAGLNEFDVTLVERELGRGAYALPFCSISEFCSTDNNKSENHIRTNATSL